MYYILKELGYNNAVLLENLDKIAIDLKVHRVLEWNPS